MHRPFSKSTLQAVLKIFSVPSRESKVHIEAQPNKPCLHHLGVGFCCPRDVDEIAIQGKHDVERCPQIRWGRSRLQRETTIDRSVIEAADVGCPPETETSGEKGVGSIGL